MLLFLDDTRQPPPGFSLVRWPDEAIEALKTGRVEHLSLDHDLGDDTRGTGYDVILWIEEQVATRGWNPPGIIEVHSSNSSARVKMENGIESIRRLQFRNALDAYISLRANLQGIRKAYAGGLTPEATPEHVMNLLGAVYTLDCYLTGKTSGRCSQDLECARKLWGLEDWTVYLSDGGYSRIVLSFDPPWLWIVRLGISTPTVISRWEMIEEALAE
jgi:hypothetical protein